MNYPVITKSINYINLISGLLLAATSIYFTKIQQIWFYVFFISFFLEIFSDKKWRNLSSKPTRFYFLAIFIYFFLILIYHPFEHSDKYFKKLLELRLALFGFSVVGFFGLNKLYKVSYFANTFIFSALIAIAILFHGVGFHEVIHNPQRLSLISTFRVENINSHIVFNAYLNIALICVWYLIFRVKTRYNILRISFYIILALIFILNLAISEGRVGIAVCLVIMGILAVYEVWKHNKLYFILLSLLLPMIAWFVITNHQRVSTAEITSDPRSFIWKAASETMQREPLIGYGASRGQEELDETLTKYSPAGFRESWGPYVIMHSHNQFFQSYLEFGIVGVIFMLIILGAPVFIAHSDLKIFTTLLLLIFVMQCMTDIVVTFQGFPVILGSILLMVLCVPEKEQIFNNDSV